MNTEREDMEANMFAMELLMPEEWVRKEVAKMNGLDMCNDKHITTLAKKFGVPVTVMGIRLGQLYGVPYV